MSSEVKPKLTPGAVPLMEPIRFYSAFRTASSKREKLEELERAISLFIQVLQNHEINKNLKDGKIQEANKLRMLVRDTRLAHLHGRKSENFSELHKSYQQTVNNYVGTTTQLQTFENRFKQLWEDPMTTTKISAAENIHIPTGLSPGASSGQAKDSVVTSASKTIRRVFSVALSRTLLTKRGSNDPLFNTRTNESGVLEGSVNQDLQTFHEIAAQIIESDPELRQSIEIEEFERHSDDSDREYRGPRPAMKPFEYPIRSALGEEDYATEPYNRSTFIGQPAVRTRPPGVMGHVHQLSDITEFRIIESELGHEDPGPSYFRQSTSAYAATPASVDQVSVSSLRTGSTESNYGDAWQSKYDASDNAYGRLKD